jgi:thiosulfate/3-mercaptopyruvate sulfurtransferase
VCALPGLLVSGAWLADNLNAVDLRIVDVRPAEHFAQSHLPGAVHLDLASLATEVDGTPGMLIGPDAFAAMMGQLGIDDTSSVVLYDADLGKPAARVLWALATYGHLAAAVLDGGWDRWLAEGRPVTRLQTVSPATYFVARPIPAHMADFAWVRDHLDDPGVVFVDTRAPEEYARGHLPGAVNWEWRNGLSLGDRASLRPVAELSAELAALGVTPDREIVTYCRSGMRASHTYLLLRHLGYTRVRNYDGSWLEWAARRSEPNHTNQ